MDYATSCPRYVSLFTLLSLIFDRKGIFQRSQQLKTMVEVIKKGVLLTKTDLEFENEAVSNPCAFQDGNTVHLYYRAVSQGNFSSIGYCRLNGPDEVEERLTRAIISPESGFESHGVEDPRIVKIDGLFYLTYTAYDGVNAFGALAISKDLFNFTKLNIITPLLSYNQFEEIIFSREDMDDRYSSYYSTTITHSTIERSNFIWNKDVMFFPRRINGKLYFMHRIKPDIQLVAVKELSELTIEFWNEYIYYLEEHTILKPKYKHEIVHIGGGAPPIETSEGWLIIYHGVRYCLGKGNVYSACAALLDLNNPFLEIARLSYPLFEPDQNWEQEGQVNNVCFPSGTSLFGDTLTIYYGAADEQIARASVSLSGLLAELTTNSKTK